MSKTQHPTAELLRPPLVMSANPHYYDYIHWIRLEADGSVRMVDGGGQALRRELRGKFRVLVDEHGGVEVLFHDLVDVDPYERSSEKRKVDDLRVQVVCEEGPFALPCEVVWHVTDEQAPWLLCTHRLAFSQDPLSAGRPSLPDFPPEYLEHPEIKRLVDSDRVFRERSRRYYLSTACEELPFCKLREKGLPERAFAKEFV